MTTKKRRTKKIPVEYAIYKMYDVPEYWDGGFKTLAEAQQILKKSYYNEFGPQDFAVYKVTTTLMRSK